MNFVTNVIKKYMQNEPQPAEDTPKQPDVVPSTSEDKENGFSHKPQPETAKSDVGSDSHKPKLRLSFLKAFDPLYSESPEKVQTTSSSKPELREQAVTEESETFECEESAKLLNVSEDEGSFVDASANYDDANAGPISADKNVEVEESLLKFYTPEKLQSAEQACDSEAVESTSEAVVSTSEAVVSTPEAVASTSTAVESTSKAAEKKPSFSHLAAIWASEAQKQPQPASGFTSDITESEIVRAISKKLSSHREVVQTRSKFTLTEVQFETYKTRRQRLLAETRARQGSGSDETSSSGSLNEVQRTSPERSCETRNEVSLASVARVDEPSESLSAEDDSSDSVELEFEEESSEESLKSEITVVIEQPRLVHSGSQYESEAAASSGRKETESQSKVGCHSTLEKICEAVEEPCVRKEAESQSEQNTEDVGSEVKPTFSTNERSSSPDRPASSDSSSSSDRLVRVKFRYMCLPDDNAIIEITNPSGSSSERSSDSSFFNFAAAEETYYQTAVEKYGKELAKNKSTASSLGEEKQADPRVEPELTKTEVSRSGSSEEEKEIQVGAKESGAEANKSELEAAAGSPEAEEQVGAVESTQIDALSQDKFEIKIESPQEEELKEPETETKLVEEISEPTTEVKLAEKEASINKSELVIESASLQEKEPEIKTYESKPEVEGGDAHIEEQGFKEEVELQPKETQKESGSSESESEPQSKLEPDITKEEASDQTESEPQKTESAVEEGTANTDLSVSDRKVEETDKNQISDQTKSEPQKTDSVAEETGNTGLSVSDTKVEDTDTDRNQISDQTESEPQKTDSTVEEGTTNTDLSVSDRKVEETDKNQISDRTESEPQKTDSTVEDTDADRKIEKTGESKEVLESEGLLKSDTFIKPPEEEHHLDSGLDSIEESDTKTLKSTVSDSEGSAERELEVFREREDSCHLPVENLDHTENEPKIQTQWTETADEEQLTGKASRHEQAKLDEPNQPKAEEETVRSEVDEPAINLTDNQKSGIKTTDGDIYIAKMTDLSEKLSEQQQENSDLKLQLNAIQQAKASLELEIRQKEEVIIKTQAEALKNEQIFKQEIKLLREKLKENSKLIEKDGSKELEDQLKEAKAKEAKAVAELTQKIKDDLNYQKIMEEYENTIAARCADYQKLKEDHETATRHLANIELAFSDVHQKYERTKALLENFKANEEALNAALQACEKTCRQHEEKYESLKAHAKGQIEKSNKEILMLRDKYEMDINKLKAIIKRLEIKCSSLEVSFQQKTEECTALSALCEEVTGKKV